MELPKGAYKDLKDLQAAWPDFGNIEDNDTRAVGEGFKASTGFHYYLYLHTDNLGNIHRLALCPSPMSAADVVLLSAWLAFRVEHDALAAV